MRKGPGHLRGAIAIGVLACGAMAGVHAVQAGTIVWEKSGAFQTCLETRLNAWVNAKAELVANEDPAAGDINDIEVAQWTIQALKACEIQVGRGDQASEKRFSQHMAHWREHIYAVAQGIRQRGRAD
jgi:hypothetical protein